MRKLYMTLIILSSVLFLSSCGSDVSGESDESTKVYYLDETGSRIVSEETERVNPDGDMTNAVNGFLELLQKNGSDGTLGNPIEPKIELEDMQIKENKLTLFFTGAYNNKTGIMEILSRACIVKTLSQVNGIDKIEFFVEDQPLMIQGESVGLMDGDSFVENLGDQGEPVERMVTLYFADADGQRLRRIRTKVEYPAAKKNSEVLLNCLIDGPGALTGTDTTGLLPTIPNGSVVNSLIIRDNICYVDFSQEFAVLLSNVSSDVIVYSIVNTLCEQSNVSRVQFTIAGSVKEKYGETLGFHTALERNLDIVVEDSME